MRRAMCRATTVATAFAALATPAARAGVPDARAWPAAAAGMPARMAAAAPAAAAPVDTGVVRLSVAPEGNEARYRVREQLARVSFPSDAVGVTSRIDGRIVLDASGDVVRDESGFTIDLASFESDSGRRDNYLRRNTLQTARHPEAVFVPTGVQGLPWPLPSAGAAHFQLAGELTIRNVTRPVTWDVTARFSDGEVAGTAMTRFTFDEFELRQPRVASVLSVADEIRLEYEFRLVAATAASLGSRADRRLMIGRGQP